MRINNFRNHNLIFEVSDTGPIDGEIFVLLHGFPERRSSWNKVAELLNQKGYRTLIPDQRGYSPQARPNGRFSYRIGELTEDIRTLTACAGKRVHLVGHDWGAMVAWSFAAKYPEALYTLTTVSVPHPAAFFSSTLSSKQLFYSFYMFLFQVPVLPEVTFTFMPRLTRRWLKHLGMNEQQIARFYHEIVEDGALTGGLNWYRAMIFTNPLSFGRKITVPTTHIWSDQDRALVKKGAELTGKYVNGSYKMKIMHDVSHWIPDEAPEALVKIILDESSESRV